MSIAEKAAWIIERNSGRPLTLGRIAGHCGVSRTHLASAFGTALGLSVIQYLRGRRLTAAASALAAGAPDILRVALDAGYGSHAAFTRAFRGQFGLTPEQVRERGTTTGLSLVDPVTLPARATQRLDPPRIVEQGPCRVAGLREPHTFDSLMTIPAQWQRFMPYCDAITDQSEEIPVGVSQVLEREGTISYLCGVVVGGRARWPMGLEVVEIRRGTWAMFEHRGHVSTIYQTYAAIWNEALPRSGLVPADTPTIERHHPTFDPRTGEGGLTLCIPLAQAAGSCDRPEPSSSQRRR